MFAESNKIISDTCRRSLPALLGRAEITDKAEAGWRAIVKLKRKGDFYQVDIYAHIINHFNQNLYGGKVTFSSSWIQTFPPLYGRYASNSPPPTKRLDCSFIMRTARREIYYRVLSRVFLGQYNLDMLLNRILQSNAYHPHPHLRFPSSVIVNKSEQLSIIIK